MKRGACTKQSAKLITVWLPDTLFHYIDRGVAIEDTDRSKFVRRAIREKLLTLGIKSAGQ